MKPRYMIFKMQTGSMQGLIERLRKSKLNSIVVIGDHAIVARYHVNKGTLRKILYDTMIGRHKCSY